MTGTKISEKGISAFTVLPMMCICSIPNFMRGVMMKPMSI